jgi:branched-chain amino acid transport system substrate-binding protein
MTLVLYIPFNSGALLISDRLNLLYTGQKTEVDKIIRVSSDTVIGFSGPTELCLNIIDQIKAGKKDLSYFQISDIIKKTYYEIRKVSGVDESLEFFVAQNTNQIIKLWKITNIVSNELNPNLNYAIGMHTSIIPQLGISLKQSTFEQAIKFGAELIGYVSKIESGVGLPPVHGCNLCYINPRIIKLETIYPQINLTNLMYRLHSEKESKISPLHGQIIRIGYISSSTTGLETAVPLLKNIIEMDLNSFASQLGYDAKFEIVIRDAKGNAAEHLAIVHGLHEMGINFIIGGGWSSQAAASLQYCNENGILLFSHSSTSPLLAIPNDNFFRMCATDLVQAPAIAEMLWSYGIKAIIVLQRGDAWADGIFNILKPEYEKRGGVILERVRYAAEVTEFSSYLQAAENALSTAKAKYGADRIGVELISFQEAVTIVTQAKDYPTIYNVPWFGSDGTSMTRQLIDDAPEQSARLRIFSTLAAASSSDKYGQLYDRYYQLIKQPLGFYSACLYDVAWAIAKAILEAQSTNVRTVIQIIPRICYDLWGASGWCRLNADGDRCSCNYDIWGYGGSPVQNILYGYYNGVNGQVNWNTQALGFTPKGHDV